MFDITLEEIQNLNDTDLRTLVGLLCEASITSYGLEPKCVHFGGHQDECDGGIDVLVDSKIPLPNKSYIISDKTIFQVKKPKMPPSRIRTEMLDNNELKHCIKQLAECEGAYIIVSSGDNVTYKSLTSRLDEMNKIIEENKLSDKIKVEFYDSSRLISWIKLFPSIVSWVKEKNGHAYFGWKPYGNWSNDSEVEMSFIYDDNTYLYKNFYSNDNKISISEGIDVIRAILNKEKESVRLAGLSGVGKTRFAQVLFDDNIGSNSLNKHDVIYGDIGNSLLPNPEHLVEELIRMNKRAILIVDNCSEKIHSKLTKLCQSKNSLISLMTIEYDVSEDDNINTNNFYLSNASNECVSKVIKSKFPNISTENIETIVTCADGNYRVAVYLCQAINNQNIGVLNHIELFERLFYQNGSQDKELLKVGRICSLVYSFEFLENSICEHHEIFFLSSIANMDPLVFFEKVKELEARQLIQKRGKMRALLPPALANRLAIDCLNYIPMFHILENISKGERLEVSFLRRLKFLHNCDKAVTIAASYLESISDDSLLNPTKKDIEMLKCINILNPELVLSRIEKIKDPEFYGEKNRYRWDIGRIISHAAYDSKIFHRAVKLLIQFVLNETNGKHNNSLKEELYRLFHIYLSYTHADVYQRLEVVKELIDSTIIAENELGIRLLRAMLKNNSFMGTWYDVGSQIRDYGVIPNGKEWFETVLQYAFSLLVSEKYNKSIREMLADRISNLLDTDLYSYIERMIEEYLSKYSWPELWVYLIELRHICKQREKKRVSISKLNILIEKCVPKSIEDKLIAYLNTNQSYIYYVENPFDNDKTFEQEIYDTGVVIGENLDYIYNCLNNQTNVYYLKHLADGMYRGINNKLLVMDDLLDRITDNNNDVIITILKVFVNQLHNDQKQVCERWLSKLANELKFIKYYPIIQLSYTFEESDMNRILKFIDSYRVDVLSFQFIHLCWGSISVGKILMFYDKIKELGNSEKVIAMTLYYLIKDRKELDDIKQFARQWVSEIDWSDNVNVSFEHLITEITKEVFSRDDGYNEAKKIFHQVSFKVSESYNINEFREAMKWLIKVYPILFLDTFLLEQNIPKYALRVFVKNIFKYDSLMSEIPDEILIRWVDKHGKVDLVSSLIVPIKYDEKQKKYQWTSYANFLFVNYIDNNKVMNNLYEAIFPNSWSGRYSIVLENRRYLLSDLLTFGNENLKTWASLKIKNFDELILEYRQKEKEENISQYFEDELY